MKSDEMKCSLDFLTKLETNLFNNIMIDFTQLTSIYLYSDKFGPKELQRYEDSYRRGNKVTIFDYMHKPDIHPKQ